MEILLIIRTNFGEPNNNNNNKKTLVGGKIYFGRRFFDVRSVLITHFKLTYLKNRKKRIYRLQQSNKIF